LGPLLTSRPLREVGPRRRSICVRVEPCDQRPTLPYVMVQHQPDQWVEARIKQQWRYEGRWRLSVYYYVGIGMQHYRVYDADQCRPVGSAQPQDDQQRDDGRAHGDAHGEDDPPRPLSAQERARP
jgi:hypothetical protein